MTQNNEREAIVRWLRDDAIRVGGQRHRWPIWRHFIWGLLHPRKFGEDYGRMFALINAANAVERGDHLENTNDGR